jgi:cell division protein FtsA
MINTEQIIVGLEVGTSKTCAVVAEVLDAENIQIIGIGQTTSQGVRKGEIVDMDAAGQSIHDAIAEAEDSASVEIHNVYASVTGGHIRCFNNRGSVVVANEDREITDEEVRSVLQNAKAVNIPHDHVIVHSIRQHFFVDGHDGIQNPVGMIGAKLEADVHIIHGVRTRLQNTIRCIKQVPLDLSNIAVSGFASSLAVLTTEDQQLGALVLDIGGGTTDYIAYTNGTIRHSGVLAVGGEHITNDIAVGLRLPMPRAERLKIEHGSVQWPIDDEIITLKADLGLSDRQVSKEQLCHIMNLRVEETLTLVKKELEKTNLLPYLRAGVFITGGCARLRGLEPLAQEIFGLPVHIGHSQTINGPTAAIESPEYSTAIGLLRFALGTQRDQHQAPSFGRKLGQTFQTLIQRARALFM